MSANFQKFVSRPACLQAIPAQPQNIQIVSTDLFLRAVGSSVTVEGISLILEKSPPSSSTTCFRVAFSAGMSHVA